MGFHFSQLVEIEFENTHFSSEGKFESAIDRMFWTFPTWASKLLVISKPSSMHAYTMHRRGLSDHTAIGIVVSEPSSLPPSRRPVPSFVTRSPIFKKRF